MSAESAAAFDQLLSDCEWYGAGPVRVILAAGRSYSGEVAAVYNGTVTLRVDDRHVVVALNTIDVVEVPAELAAKVREAEERMAQANAVLRTQASPAEPSLSHL